MSHIPPLPLLPSSSSSAIPFEPTQASNTSSPPLTPTPTQQHHALVSTATARLNHQVNAIRPPTPAPSPQPRSRAGTQDSRESIPLSSLVWRSTTTNDQDDQDQEEPPSSRLSLLTESDLIASLVDQINFLTPTSRQLLLTQLINDSTPSTLSPLIHLITPRLKRDFLKTLPVELAFHVLSFVDEVTTLSRASGVSRFWRALLEDDATWKRMCWKSGFGNAPLPPQPQAQPLVPSTTSIDSEYQFGKMRNLEFGTPEEWDQEDEMFTPAGRERRGTLDRVALSEFAARAELFDLPVAMRRRGSQSTRPNGRGSRSGGIDQVISEEEIIARDRSDRAREREGSWSDAPPSHSTLISNEPQSSLEQAELQTGLGFTSSIVSTSSLEGLSERRRSNNHVSSRSVPPPPPLDSNSQSQRRTSPLESTPQDLSHHLPSRNPQPRHFSLPASSSSSTSNLVSPPMFSLPNISPSPSSSTSSYAPLPTSSTATTTFPTPPPPAPLNSSGPGPTNHQSFPPLNPFSYKTHFKRAYLTESSWLRGPGRLLSTQMSADDGVVTSLGFDEEWIVVGMATSKVHVFEAGEGRYVRTLEGHDLGVWCLTLVSTGGGPRRKGKGKGKDRSWEEEMEEEGEEWETTHQRSQTGCFNSPPRAQSTNRTRRRSFPSALNSNLPPSNDASDQTKMGGMGLGAGGPTGDSQQQSGVCSTARGWGQKGAVVVSGGCDREVRVWQVESGECLHTLRGHTSTVRCMRVLDGRPIAVSGSRDATLRVWDIEKGECLHLLSGHEHSVRCIEVSGNKVVSGSYDATCRLWDVDTGECLHVFRGHIHQIYAVAFDGIRVVTGSLDSTVRIWSAETGEFLALLQGHTSLVGQLVLLPSSPSSASAPATPPTLITGGSDGRVIVFDLSTFDTIHRLCAHDNSVTCLQVDERFIVTGGNDGRIKLWDFRTGLLVRELSEPCGAVWRVVFRDDKCVTLCRRDGKTLMDVRTFRPSEEELFGDGQ
ncbi:hypothetical protein JCM5353_006448 [Sporobolomyces roseus]